MITALKSKGYTSMRLKKGSMILRVLGLKSTLMLLTMALPILDLMNSVQLVGLNAIMGIVQGATFVTYEHLNIKSAHATMKPIIRVIGGGLYNVDLAEQELAKVGKYYQRGSLITTIVKDKTTGETRDVKQPALAPILSRCATWEVYDGRNQSVIIKDPPERMISALMNAPEYNHLPYLRDLARQPYLSPDGNIINQSGYDAETCMYGAFNQDDYDIPESPSKRTVYKH